jgi:hypothetical protein
VVRFLAVENGDADRAGQHDLLARNLDRRAQRAANALGVLGQLRHRLVRQQQQAEAVAGNASQRIVGPEVALQPPRDGEQQAVAEHEAERRAEAGELVDIDDQYGRADLRLRLGPHHRHFETVEQQLAVGQPRQAVVHGIVQQAFMRPLGVGHVANQAYALERARIGTRHAGRFQLEPAIVVIGLPQAEFAAHLAVAPFLHREQRQPEPLAVGRMKMAHEIIGPRREIPRREPKQDFNGLADLDLVAARIPFPHRGPRGVDRD